MGLGKEWYSLIEMLFRNSPSGASNITKKTHQSGYQL